MPQLAPVAPALLQWYYQNRRILPFREDPTPYHIWVSEIMLQQTRVAAALPYYHRFMQALPTIQALANCSEEKLHKLWEGLGYYSRVRNLQKAAKIVVEQYGGALPGNYSQLLALPGIGEYTAGAIASIAFGLPEVAVDGNVLRVFSRLLASPADIAQPFTKKALGLEVKRQQPPEKAGDYNQAIMELGALVCLPGEPQCTTCPLAGLCHGFARGIAAALPYKEPKKEKQLLDICVFVVHSGRRVLLQQRPPQGLLAGLWQPPLAEGLFSRQQAMQLLQQFAPGAALEKPLPTAKHIFTHKIWNLYGWQCAAPVGTIPLQQCTFVTPAQISGQYTLPGAFKTYLPFMVG